MGKLAIKGGESTKSKPFPLYPIITEEDKKAVLRALNSGRWARNGNDNVLNKNSYHGYIEELEKTLAEIHENNFALAVTNCTAALEIAVQSIDNIGPGDEVIVTPYSFIASASCILKAGAIPVFADIDKATWNLDPNSIESCITSKTKAIVVVHFAGQSADIDRIHAIAEKYQLKVIGDAAHAITSKWDGKPVGTTSDITCFSLQSSKNVTCGEGGVLVTNNEEYYKKAFSLHMTGRAFNGNWYQHAILGSNYRITEFQAALACSQLKKNSQLEQRRRENGEYLIKCLRKIEGIEPTTTCEKGEVRDYHLITFRYKKEYWKNLSKKRLIMALNAEGIPCHGGYEQPIYKNQLFKLYSDTDYLQYEERCPVTEGICSEAVWFHQHLLLGDKQDMDEIIESIIKIKNNLNEITRG